MVSSHQLVDIEQICTHVAFVDKGRTVRVDTLGAISFYKQGCCDRVSEALYKQLVSALEKMKEQTGMPEHLAE